MMQQSRIREALATAFFRCGNLVTDVSDCLTGGRMGLPAHHWTPVTPFLHLENDVDNQRESVVVPVVMKQYWKVEVEVFRSFQTNTRTVRDLLRAENLSKPETFRETKKNILIIYGFISASLRFWRFVKNIKKKNKESEKGLGPVCQKNVP